MAQTGEDMKLGILCTMINGFGRRGFYNTQEIGLGRALVRKGHTVTIYKCLKKEGEAKVEKVDIEPGLTIYYLPIGGLGAHGYLRTEVLAQDLDGMLCFSDNQVLLPHIYRFCRRNGIRFVPYVGTTFSLHGGLHAKVMDTWFAMGTLKIYKENPVIAKTEGARRELEALGVRDISIAPVGLDTAVLKSDFKQYEKAALRAQYGFEADDVLLCNVSRMDPEKRPLDMVEIFNRIRKKKKFRLLLVGEGPLRAATEEKVAQYGLKDEIRMINRIPYEEMWKIYAMSDYFINLSTSEIFGMAIMEAVYYETSVTAFAAAPGPSLTLKGMAGHCLCEEDGQVEAWLTAPYPSAQDLEESARRMEREFGWDRCADRFVSIIERE